MSRVIGNVQENKALEYLQKQGLKLLARNFRSRLGEIDLIMRDKEVLAFIEVRYRSNQYYGGSAASISYQKQQKIIRTSQLFLQQHQQFQHLPCRFDLIAIDQSIDWLQNAFQL